MFRSYRPSGADDRPTPPCQRPGGHRPPGPRRLRGAHPQDSAGKWAYVLDSRYNRRLTGMTPMRLSGPAHRRPLPARPAPTPTVTPCWGCSTTPAAAGRRGARCSPRRRTSTSTSPTATPWAAPTPCRPASPATGSPAGPASASGRPYYDRFDVSKEPNEPNRFGWIVEVDPYDPTAVPVKRTALGRLKHEAAAGTLAPNGRWVVLHRRRRALRVPLQVRQQSRPTSPATGPTT